MNAVPGVSGRLLPGRYIAEALLADAAACGLETYATSALERRLSRWWDAVTPRCGPTTAVAAIVDLVARPLIAMLDFRVRRVVIDRDAAVIGLDTPRDTPVVWLVRPWAARPSTATRDAHAAATAIDAAWAFVLAPPFLSLVAIRGQAARRAVEFSLPDVTRPPATRFFLVLARSAAFDRPDTPDAPRPIDALVARADVYQARVRRDLQRGVMTAHAALSAACAPGPMARQRRSPRPVPAESARDQALTIVYRILFLLFAESRDLVPHRHAVYAGAYAMSQLCRVASVQGARGLWDALAATARLARSGCQTAGLDVPAFNGALFARSAAPALETRPSRRRPRVSDWRDDAARTALLALGFRAAGRETISFRDLGVEQLGGIYEGVLDALAPVVTSARRTRHSPARRRTGTFYTPQPLTDFVVRRTLGPLVSGATADQILALRVVDPAMGSGAFLVSSCGYLASAYEHALVEDGRASATDFGEDDRAAIRRLIAERCLAGVDRNPTAVHLARLSLWLTTMAAGKPLSFLDHRLRVGDSLVGAWPDDLRRFARRKGHQAAALPLFADVDVNAAVERAAPPLRTLLARSGDTLEDVRAKETLWRRISDASSPLAPWRDAFDLWCARWFWPPDETPAPDDRELRALLAHRLGGDGMLPKGLIDARLHAARAARDTGAFFHWPIEFPDIFFADAAGAARAPGFDAVLGNPPWEMVRSDPAEGAAPPSGEAPATGGERRDRQPLVRFIRDSGAYRSCTAGHVNLYQPFVERALMLTRAHGRTGLILPWSFAADDGAAALRARLLDDTRLDAIVGLDNAAGIFPIHRGMRFLVVTTSPGTPTAEFRARCGVRRLEDLEALPAVDLGPASLPVRLARASLATIGGPARRLPDIRRASDADWLERICASAPRLGSAEGWHVTFGRELNATEARRHFAADGLPVLEGKHIAPFRVGVPADGARIDPRAAARMLPARPFDRPRLAYRDVASASNRVSLIAAIAPAGCVTTHTLLCLNAPLPLEQQRFLCALFNSYVLNAVVRAVMGGHVTTSIVEGLPVPPWRGDRPQRRIAALADAPRDARALARLQARVARLYNLSAPQFARILETFPLVPAEERARAARSFARDAVDRASNDGLDG